MYKDNLARYIAIAVVILILIGFFVINYYLNKPASRIVEGEADFQIPAYKLYAEFQEDEKKANERYLNKILSVYGLVTKISEPDSLGFTVTLDTKESPGISCEIADAKEATTIIVGDTITVTGLCTGMLMDVVLVKCKIEHKELINETI